MLLFAVDDERLLLEALRRSIAEAAPEAEIRCFDSAKELLHAIDEEQRLVSFFLLLALLAAMISAAPQAAAEEYTYTVRFLAGVQGTIDGKEILVYEGLHYGERITFDMTRVKVNNGSKYYARGIRESGLDNSTVGALSFTVTKDQDYVVAYGVRGSEIAYTVRYLDRNGRELAPTETFYGNTGDKPVVAYRYIDGYFPNYYNLTKTLSENAADNVFTFRYFSEADLAPAPAAIGTAVPTPTPAAGGAPDTSEQSVETPEPGTEPAVPQTEEIGDLDAPMAEFDNTSQPQTQPQKPKSTAMIVLAAVIVLVLLLLLILLLKKRKEKKREESRR